MEPEMLAYVSGRFDAIARDVMGLLVADEKFRHVSHEELRNGIQANFFFDYMRLEDEKYRAGRGEPTREDVDDILRNVEDLSFAVYFMGRPPRELD